MQQPNHGPIPSKERAFTYCYGKWVLVQIMFRDIYFAKNLNKKPNLREIAERNIKEKNFSTVFLFKIATLPALH